MQIHAIVQSLKQIASEAPMAAALTGPAGFSGDIEHGTDASPEALRPYGLLNVQQTGAEGNSSGVKLVTYVAVLQVFGDEDVTLIGNILDVFHRYWDRISGMPSLEPTLAKFVQIHPTTAGLGETEDENQGKDTLLGETAWEIQIKETQPPLE